MTEAVAKPDEKCQGSYNAAAWTNCTGTLTYGLKSQAAGDNYTGEFKNEKMHGTGTYIHADGPIYIGK